MMATSEERKMPFMGYRGFYAVYAVDCFFVEDILVVKVNGCADITGQSCHVLRSSVCSE